MIPKSKLRFRSKPRPVVLTFDPAIDREASDITQYALTRDLDHLKYKEGKAPMIFHLRNLPKAAFDHMMEVPGEFARYEICFRLAVERIENVQPHLLREGCDFDIPLSTLEPTEEWHYQADGFEKTYKVFDKEEMEYFAPAVLAEIGSIIFGACFLVNGIEVKFSLPRTSMLLLGMIGKPLKLNSAEAKQQQTEGNNGDTDNPTQSPAVDPSE